MSYKLEKPYTPFERADFIVKHNHKNGLEIKELADGTIFALEKNEIMQNGKPIVNPNYEQELAKKRQAEFNTEFFKTSLGWIRRKVSMKDGSQKDFLSDLLLQIKAGIELGQQVEIITYKLPDFTKSITEDYMHTLQEKKTATLDFVKECLMRTVADFSGD